MISALSGILGILVGAVIVALISTLAYRQMYSSHAKDKEIERLRALVGEISGQWAARYLKAAIEASEVRTSAMKSALKLRQAYAEVERLRGLLEKLDNWANAYPLDIFPEPDFERVRELLEAGTYTIDVLGRKGANNGKTDLYLDGVKVSGVTPFDWYASPAEFNVLWTMASIDVAYNGRHQVKIKVNGKNASSGGYKFSGTRVTAVRTA